MANPTLVDGDATTPASPPVEIGGASTFRNIGVDLGVTRPITRLEIATDLVSGPSVVWQVFRSRDNLFWEAVPGATSTFDSGLLRYRIRFPRTEDRFWKAVNVSANPAPAVRVTEIRALLDLATTALDESTDDNRYRGDVILGFNPSRRVSLAVGFGASSDETLAAGLVRRDYEEAHALARLTVGLARSLDLNFGYRYNDSENRRDPVLLRTVEPVQRQPDLEAPLDRGRGPQRRPTRRVREDDPAAVPGLRPPGRGPPAPRRPALRVGLRRLAARRSLRRPRPQQLDLDPHPGDAPPPRAGTSPAASRSPGTRPSRASPSSTGPSTRSGRPGTPPPISR